MADSDDQPPQGDWRPRPDPTQLTTEALLREITQLDRLINQRIDSLVERMEAAIVSRTETIAGMKELIDERAVGYKEAITLARLENDKRFDRVQEQIARLSELSRDFIPRAEGAVAHKGIEDKLDTQIARTAERFMDIHHALDRTGGGEIAAKQASQKAFAIWAAVVAGVGIVIGIASLAVVIVR